MMMMRSSGSTAALALASAASSTGVSRSRRYEWPPENFPTASAGVESDSMKMKSVTVGICARNESKNPT